MDIFLELRLPLPLMGVGLGHCETPSVTRSILIQGGIAKAYYLTSEPHFLHTYLFFSFHILKRLFYFYKAVVYIFLKISAFFSWSFFENLISEKKLPVRK